MSLPELKQLDKIIALCRKRGVSEITVDGVTIKLGDAPIKRSRQTIAAQKYHEDGEIETSELSQEDMLFWSAQNPDALSEGS